jgi:FkbM family methyltransferase
MPSAHSIAHTLSQHAHEMGVCLSRGTTLPDRVRLARDTARFHIGNRLKQQPDFESADTYHVTVAGRDVDLKLRLGAGDFFVFHEVFTGDCYRLPQEWAGKVRTIVDLGGHVGLTSLFFLESFPHARLVAVEATPDNASVLRHNLSSFADRALVIEAAIADAPGTARFQSSGWSWERRLGAPISEDAGFFQVECVTVDDVMRRAELSSIDLLKIDVEGAEQAILANDPAWLRNVGAIVIELHEPYSLEQFANAIAPAGFTVVSPSAASGIKMIVAVREGAFAAR